MIDTPFGKDVFSMKLKTRLFLGFASLLAIMAVFFGSSIYSLDRANKSVEKSQQERYQKIKYSKTVENELNNISRYLRDLALMDVNYDFAETIKLIRASREEVESALGSLEASAIREVTKDLVLKIKTENRNYTELQENCIALASAGKQAEFEQAINVGGVERRQIFKYVEELNSLEDKSMNDFMKSSSDAYNRAILFFFFSLLVTLLAGVGITLWITRRVTGGIRSITDVMNRFSSIQEHIDLPRIEIHSNDEIGEIAASFNEMARSLEEHALHEKDFVIKIEGQNWLKSGTAEITALCQGIED